MSRRNVSTYFINTVIGGLAGYFQLFCPERKGCMSPPSLKLIIGMVDLSWTKEIRNVGSDVVAQQAKPSPVVPISHMALVCVLPAPSDLVPCSWHGEAPENGSSPWATASTWETQKKLLASN